MKHILLTGNKLQKCSSVEPVEVHSAPDGVMIKPRSESAFTKKIGTNAIEGGTKITYQPRVDYFKDHRDQIQGKTFQNQT